jgi:hypothetical protein
VGAELLSMFFQIDDTLFGQQLRAKTRVAAQAGFKADMLGKIKSNRCRFRL